MGPIALALTAAAAAAPASCPPDDALAYVCGIRKPEDVRAIPGTPWLVTSGFAPGAGLTLVDMTRRTTRSWYRATPPQLAYDRTGFPACPGRLDPRLFNARGLALVPTGPARFQLLVVNHGGRESIEAFDVATDGAAPPVLRWRGCIPMPAGQVGNAVARFADGTVLVTVLTRPGTTIADFMQGRATGAVWAKAPGETALHPLPGTALPGNNGLEVDPDGRHFYVVAFGWHALLVYDRTDTRQPRARLIVPDFMPDNVHWSDGRLLLAGMRLDEPACGGLRSVAGGVADPMLCHRGWVIGEADLAHGRIATVAYGRPQPGFNGLSTAVIAGGALWLGSFQADRLAIVRGWQQSGAFR